MKYEQTALDYSAITMEMLRTQGVDMKKVAGEVIAFAKRSTLSKGYQCKPVLVGQNIAFDIGFLQQLMNYAGLAAEFEKDLFRYQGLLRQLPAALHRHACHGTVGFCR